jgi:excisionase family DNA binding protein
MSEVSFENLPQAVSKLSFQLANVERLLSNLISQPEIDQLLTIKQAGEFVKLTPPTIYGLVSRNEIPYSKKGKRLYFSKQQLFDWIQQGRKKTISEIENEAHTYIKTKKQA